MLYLIMAIAAFAVFLAVQRFGSHGIALMGSLAMLGWIFHAGVIVAGIISCIGIILVVSSKGVVS